MFDEKYRQTYILLCALTTNYVRWMFLLVSSVNAMGCQEILSGEQRFTLRNLRVIDT